MKFGLLGPVSIAREDGPLKLEGPRVRALLAYLLLHANKPVSTTELLEALWGDEYPRSGATAVQNAVVRLRRVLGERVVTAGSGYLVRVEPGELDLDRFRDLVTRAKSSPPTQATELLRSALALWNGEPLGGTAGAAFAERAAAALQDERLAAVAAQVDAELALGRHAALVPMLSTLTAEQPLDERFRAQLIIALYRAGRQAAALDVYRETRRLLMDELGLEPGPALRELERAVLTQDPALDPPAQKPVEDEAPPLVSQVVEVGPRRSSKSSLVRVAAIVPLGVAGAALAVALSQEAPVSLANPTTVVQLSTRPAEAPRPATTVRPRSPVRYGARTSKRATAPSAGARTSAASNRSAPTTATPQATAEEAHPAEKTTTAAAEPQAPAATTTKTPTTTSTTTTTKTAAPTKTATTVETTTAAARATTRPRLVYWIADDFVEPGIDLARWHLAGYGSGVSVSEENGRLAFSVGEDVKFDPPYGADQHYGTKCLLKGDFDATVDYELLDWPANNGVSVAFGVYLPPPNESFVSIERRGATPAGGSEAYGASGGGFVQTADTSGSFRLRRTGTSVRMSYRHRGSWVSLGAVPTAGPANLILSVTTNEPQFGHKPASAAFRSFEVFADTVECNGVPLPPRRSRT